jgi:hypothetical protein
VKKVREREALAKNNGGADSLFFGERASGGAAVARQRSRSTSTFCFFSAQPRKQIVIFHNITTI